GYRGSVVRLIRIACIAGYGGCCGHVPLCRLVRRENGKAYSFFMGKWANNESTVIGGELDVSQSRCRMKFGLRPVGMGTFISTPWASPSPMLVIV
ncbi:MAG TPA: hypothetical protein VMS31_01110, partial [Pyrinomonadaceae bacterium]|nr:hypothetical protein [Pyrinomonadaceae bacterium]